MAKTILAYTSFDKVTKTITFPAATFDVKNLYTVINKTSNVLLYAPTIMGLGYTSFTSTTLVLEIDTNIGTIANTDELMILYEVSSVSGSSGGDASSANQVTGNASLSSIDTKTPSLGQAVAASSVPVVLTAAQIAALTPPAAIADFNLEATQVAVKNSIASVDTKLTSQATSTKQDTGNTSLNSIDSKIPTLGQALAGSSTPVVLTAAQIATLTPPSAITGYSLEATQALVKAKTDNLDVLLSTRLKPSDTLAAVGAINSALPAGTNNIGSVVDTVVDLITTGNITTQNLVSSGTATANSAVLSGVLNGAGIASIQVTGIYTGVLSLQGTVDGTTWVTFGGTPFLNISTGTFLATITSALQSIFQVECGGFNQIRITGLAAITGTATITIRVSRANTMVAIDTALPAGTASIGAVTVASTTITSIVPGSGSTNLGKAKASAAGATDTGIALLPQRTDNLAAQGAAGQYVLAQADKVGATYTRSVFTGKRTYSASMVVTPAVAATDIVQIIGSASTTVSISRITISGTQTTGGMVRFILTKRSTANTGGTFTFPNLVPHDSTDTSATIVISNYTANPSTIGTLVGNVKQQFIPFSTVTATTKNIYTFEFADKGKPIVLNGVAQVLAINLNGVTVAGGSINVDIEFTED